MLMRGGTFVLMRGGAFVPVLGGAFVLMLATHPDVKLSGVCAIVMVIPQGLLRAHLCRQKKRWLMM